MNTSPDDILVHIFKFLGFKDLMNVSEVCKNWLNHIREVNLKYYIDNMPFNPHAGLSYSDDTWCDLYNHDIDIPIKCVCVDMRRCVYYDSITLKGPCEPYYEWMYKSGVAIIVNELYDCAYLSVKYPHRVIYMGKDDINSCNGNLLYCVPSCKREIDGATLLNLCDCDDTRSYDLVSDNLKYLRLTSSVNNIKLYAPNLSALDLVYVNKCDVDYLLYSVSHINYLKCSGQDNISSTTFLHLRNLEYLHLSGCRIDNISCLSEMMSIKHLELCQIHLYDGYINDINHILRNLQLIYLKIHDGDWEHNNINNMFTGINKTRLESICIDGNVTNLNPFDGIPEVEIHSRGNIDDITPLKRSRVIDISCMLILEYGCILESEYIERLILSISHYDQAPKFGRICDNSKLRDFSLICSRDIAGSEFKLIKLCMNIDTSTQAMPTGRSINISGEIETSPSGRSINGKLVCRLNNITLHNMYYSINMPIDFSITNIIMNKCKLLHDSDLQTRDNKTMDYIQSLCTAKSITIVKYRNAFDTLGIDLVQYGICQSRIYNLRRLITYECQYHQQIMSLLCGFTVGYGDNYTVSINDMLFLRNDV
jgi:hypothetical protein